MAKLYFTKQLMTSEYDIGIYFKTERERNLYFNIPSIFDLSKDFNFNISGGLSATLYWNEASFLNTSILDYNYVIIDVNRQYYFYFINSAKCVTANQYQLDLELDVITTYLPSLNFEDCFIERAHASRWYTTDNINYKFNFSTNSPLLRKSEQYKQYLKQQIPLHRTYDNVSNLNNFERTRYLYIFAKLKDEEKGIIYNYGQGQSFQYPFKVYCIPYTSIQNNNAEFYVSINGGESKKIATNLTEATMPLILSTALIIGVTYSDYSPFPDSTVVVEDTTNNKYTLSFNNDYLTNITLEQSISSAVGDGYTLKINSLNINPKTYFPNSNISIDTPKMSFTKNEIKNNTNNQLTCPILLKKGCKRLELTNYYSSKYDYSYEELNTNNLSVEVLLYPFPSVEYHYAYIKGSLDSILKNQRQNFTGVVGSIDNTLPYTVEQIDQFFASNKNYYQMRNYNFWNQVVQGVGKLTQGITSGVGQLANGEAIKGTVTLTNTGLQGLQDTYNIYTREKLLDLQLDNVENAPDIINNLNGAPLTSLVLNKIGFAINVYDILEEDKKFIANDYYEHGQNVAVWDNPRNYMGTRKYFNYIKCTLKEMWYNVSPYDPIPNVIKDKIKQIFANGIRLFNGINPTNIINSSTYVENYENYLDE